MAGGKEVQKTKEFNEKLRQRANRRRLSYLCPCCGEVTYIRPEEKKYYICPVCRWEDDPYADEEGRSDANGGLTAEEARERFVHVRKKRVPGGEQN